MVEKTRQIVFVTGEGGAWEYDPVEAFLDTIGTDAAALLHRSGPVPRAPRARRAYMPVLEALGRLCRAPIGGRELLALLAGQAPSWLAEMPWLLDPGASEALEPRCRAVTQERMLREMVEALEAVLLGPEAAGPGAGGPASRATPLWSILLARLARVGRSWPGFW